MSSKLLVKTVGCCLAIALVLAAGLVYFSRHRTPHVGVKIPPVATNIKPATNAFTAASPAPSKLELTRRAALLSSFQKHPFAAVRETAAFGWTDADGKNPEVIRALAHNELEFERMAGESDRIFRRQLVYHKDTAAAQIERAKLTGEPVQKLALPGIDGQEVQFDITAADLNPSGQQGTFSGHVAGRMDSMVTFAFKGGREAFTVLSPSDNLYLVGEPREPGELIVKSINITNYVVGVCGNP